MKAISAKFGIKKIKSFKAFKEGHQNTNYLIDTGKKKFVLQVLEQTTVKKAKRLAQLLVYLEKNRFKTSKVINSKPQKAIKLWKKKPLMLKKYIKGNVHKDLSPNVLRSIGKELALLHQVKPPKKLPKMPDYGVERFAEIKKYARDSKFDLYLQEIKDYIEPYLKQDLPKALIHGDLFWNNVIVNKQKNKVVIMDFENSAYYYRVYDIGMAFVGICSEGQSINLKKARYLLEGYQSEIQLSKKELHALKAFTIYAAASMAFWRHRYFNYYSPDPKMKKHYLGLKVLADFMSQQKDSCFTKIHKTSGKKK